MLNVLFFETERSNEFVYSSLLGYSRSSILQGGPKRKPLTNYQQFILIALKSAN